MKKDDYYRFSIPHSCCFVRTKEWMEKNYGNVHVRGCVYSGTYCKYWRSCVEEKGIKWFKSKKLMLLYKMYVEEK